MQYSIISYSHHAVHYICMTYLFFNWKLVSFNPLPPFHSLPTPCLWQHALPMSMGFVLFCSFQIPHIIRSYGICRSLSTLFHLHNTLEVHSCCHNTRISFFFLWLKNIPLYIPHFLYLFIHWWTLRLLSYLGYGE